MSNERDCNRHSTDACRRQNTRLCAAPATEITLDYGAEPLTSGGAFVSERSSQEHSLLPRRPWRACAGTLVVLSAGTLFVVLSGAFVVLRTGAVLLSAMVPACPVVFSATLLIGGLIPSPFRA